MTLGRVLVAGVGNIFFRDDGFGVEVARRLTEEALAPSVKVGDFGIRGVHLAYELLDGYDTLVLVDACPRGETPGTVTVIETAADGRPSAPVDAHGLEPAAVLAALADLGGGVGRVLVVGCEPQDVGPGIGLSEPVAAAVPAAVEAVRGLVAAP